MGPEKSSNKRVTFGCPPCLPCPNRNLNILRNWTGEYKYSRERAFICRTCLQPTHDKYKYNKAHFNKQSLKISDWLMSIFIFEIFEEKSGTFKQIKMVKYLGLKTQFVCIVIWRELKEANKLYLTMSFNYICKIRRNIFTFSNWGSLKPNSAVNLLVWWFDDWVGKVWVDSKRPNRFWESCKNLEIVWSFD